MATDFAHLFSGHAADYAAHRPRYPEALYRWIAECAPRRNLAWDVGTGNGQVAVGLAALFARVHATDPSAEQLAHAESHPRVAYERCTYETALRDGSVDLVTVGQALHWFDLPAFFAEVRRVLHPDGFFAAFAYTHSQVTPEVDALVRHYHDVTLASYWAPEHHLIHAGYSTIELPLEETPAPPLAITATWSAEQFRQYLRTWSSVRRMLAERGVAEVVAFERELLAAWGDVPERALRWPLILRAGRLAG